MKDVYFIFPRWIFPNNLGDSIISTFVPKLLREFYSVEVTVITDKSLGSIFEIDPNVKKVLYDYKLIPENSSIFYIYPDWHKDVFSIWGKHHKYLTNHPSVNIITLNYCLQLGLENCIFSGIDLSPKIYLEKKENIEKKIGIAPMLKLAGKSSPHKGCDGVGFRFNGSNGYESWSILVRDLKKAFPQYEIVEFSPTNLKLGDRHVGMKPYLLDLGKEAVMMDFCITTDGGYHHLFNSLNTPLVLFNGSKISKYEFVRLGNAFCPDHLHLQCRFKCPSYFVETLNTEDLSKTCNLECENMDPAKLAEFSIEKIKSLWT